MAERNHAPAAHHHPRGAAMPIDKKKASLASVGEAMNRKALEDIGNLVNLHITDRKQVNRPITRSFGAQLLAKVNAAVPAKEQVVALPSDRDAKKIPVKKSEPEVTVTGSRSDTKQKEKKETKIGRISFSSKKKVYTLTSVLTARSKIAFGIKDIDAADADNELCMMEYVEDLYKFYKNQENLCRPRDYMSSQIEINSKMRSILVDWLIEVHQKFELMPETLYLTISIVDRYLSEESVLRKELQLVGISSMLIACKYEEIWAPEVNDFILISDQAYTREQILKMEKEILNKLNWSLTFPTPYVFLVRFLKAAASDKEMECMTFFYAELALMHYSMVMYCPSMIAASAVFAAHCSLKKSQLWSKTLQYHSGFSEQQLSECAKLILGFHSSAWDSKLNVSYKKYSKEEHGGVSLRPPETEFVWKN